MRGDHRPQRLGEEHHPEHPRGVSAPTEGEVSISGRVSSLLSLGAGFNFELTGQENVYLNGAILGLSKTQIDAIYDDIVAYADLGRFMNAKLSTYSSGMNMRLGFAIAVMVPFDVLLMDEILAVGDLSFQTKCFRTMRKFWEDEGKTVIFVSHDLVKIEEICSSVLWFEHGKIEAMGAPEEVIEAYRERYREKLALGPAVKRQARAEVPVLVTVDAARSSGGSRRRSSEATSTSSATGASCMTGSGGRQTGWPTHGSRRSVSHCSDTPGCSMRTIFTGVRRSARSASRRCAAPPPRNPRCRPPSAPRSSSICAPRSPRRRWSR